MRRLCDGRFYAKARFPAHTSKPLFTVNNDLLQSLNPAQRDAVIHYQDPSLIIAGAGSGKTRVLTSRIAYMLQEGVPAHHILALTFTNKAAREMRERIGGMISPVLGRGLWMGTFHSVFARILRAESELLGYPSTFTIYDAADAKNMVKLAIRELELDEDTYKPNNVASRISRAKNNLVTPEAYEANASLQGEDRELKIPRFLEIYKLYCRRCRENGAMDFDDLLLMTNILFRDHPEALTKYQEQFRYILVDEYQDTNFAQYVIVRRLAERYGNVCVVGDDAQSIYSFRGAKIENILRFQQDFPNARIFKLEQNYRSTQTIVNAANSVIEKNQRQIRKKAFSSGDEGEKIKVMKAYTDREESALIASDIYATVRSREVPYSEVAVLYRTNAQSRALEEALRTRNIPYKIYGGFSFYQRKEIKDLLAYIRLVINPRDNEAFRRVINTPARGIGDVTIGRIAAAAESHGISLWEAVSTLDPASMELAGAAAKKVTAFATLIGEMSAARATMEAYTLGLEIATRSGLIGVYKMQQTPESISALENIEELINSIRVFVDEQQKLSEETGEQVQASVGIEEWMQNVALLTDMDTDKPEDQNKVTLMTVHAAKGLEFSYVYIAGLEENLFPSLMSLGSSEGLEEERRLFYVALTRAKTAAVLTFAESRFKWGEMSFSRPSRFLSEIDPRYLDISFDLNTPDDESDEESPSYRRSYASDGGRSGGSAYRNESRSYGGGGGGSYQPGSPYGQRQGGNDSGRTYAAGHGSNGYRPGSGNYAGAQRPTGSGSGRGGYNPRGTSYDSDKPRTYYPPRETQQVKPLQPDGRFRSMGASRPAPHTGVSGASAPGSVYGVGSRPTGVSAPVGSPPTGFSAAPAASGEYAVGMRVEHAKFGAGVITAIEEWTNDVKLTVDFGPVGTKVLLKKFARLRIL